MQNLNENLSVFFTDYDYAWPKTIENIEKSDIIKDLSSQIKALRQKHTSFFGLYFDPKQFQKEFAIFKKHWFLKNRQNSEYQILQQQIFKNKLISQYPFLNRIDLNAYPDHLLKIRNGEEFDISPLLKKFFDTEHWNNYYINLKQILPGLVIPESDLTTFFLSLNNDAEITLLHEYEFEILRFYIFNYLEICCLKYFNTRSLDEFNHTESQKLTKVLLKHFYQIENVNNDSIKNSFENYRAALKKELLNQYNTLNPWKKTPQTEFITTQFKNSFQSIMDGFQNLADTHAFIQGTGYSTQNEHSHLAILDIVNYYRYSNQVKELKTIFHCIIRPLLPIYQEYLWLSYQKNQPLLTTIRLILPIIFFTASILGGLHLLEAFFYPELVILILLIPIAYINLIILAQLLELKNVAYQNFQEFIHGGFYNTPFFQINPRLQNFFGTDAKNIHDLYISTLKQDEQSIQQLSKLQQEVGLNSNDLNLLNDLQKKQKTMLAEWSDIHHNLDISKEQALKIVLQRIHLEANFENQEYKHLTQKVEIEIDNISQNLKEHLLQANVPTLSTTSFFHTKILNKAENLLNLHSLENKLSINQVL